MDIRPDITSQELAAAGKTGRRVTREDIEALLLRVTYRVYVCETSTFVHGYLDGKFFLGTGFSACVDPANFVAATGERIAMEDAKANITKKLWELEGYSLFKEINK